MSETSYIFGEPRIVYLQHILNRNSRCFLFYLYYLMSGLENGRTVLQDQVSTYYVVVLVILIAYE